jgi:hypothetical protein
MNAVRSTFDKLVTIPPQCSRRTTSNRAYCCSLKVGLVGLGAQVPSCYS